MADLGMLSQLLGNIGSRQYQEPDYGAAALNTIGLRKASAFPGMQRAVTAELGAPSPDRGRLLSAIGQYDPMEAARMSQNWDIASQRTVPGEKRTLDEAQQAYNQVSSTIGSLTNQAKTANDMGDSENAQRLMAMAQAMEPQRLAAWQRLQSLSPSDYGGAPAAAGTTPAPAPEVAPEGPSLDELVRQVTAMDIYDKNGVPDAAKFTAAATELGIQGKYSEPGSDFGTVWKNVQEVSKSKREGVGAQRAEEDRLRKIAEEKKATARAIIGEASKSWNTTALAKALRALPAKVPALVRSAQNLSDPEKANAAAGSVIKAAGQLVEEGVVNQGDVDLIIGGDKGLKGLINDVKSWSNPQSINVPAARQAYNNARDIVNGISAEGKRSLDAAIADASAKVAEYGVKASASDFATGLTFPTMPDLGEGSAASAGAIKVGKFTVETE